MLKNEKFWQNFKKTEENLQEFSEKRSKIYGKFDRIFQRFS